MAFSTDGPVVSNVSPWSNIQDALLRRSKNGTVISPNECINLDEAILAYTTGSAYAEGTEHIKGKLKPGYYADFIVVDKDPYGLPPEAIHQVKIEETYVNGICQWKRD